MMNKKMKILLAMGAMAAVVIASGCGGDAKSGECSEVRLRHPESHPRRLGNHVPAI